jgi:hypothetical protein
MENVMKKLAILAFLMLFQSVIYSQISFYKTFSDGGYDSGEGVIQLADSSYLITGSSSSFQGNNQAFILKIDSLGNKIWSNHYGGNEADKGRRIFHVPNDGIYVAGQSNSFGNFFDAYFFKTDELGNFIYQKNYGTSAYEQVYDAVMLADTSFLLVGETSHTANETENIYLLRINKFGDTLYTKNFGSDQKDVARSIQILNDTTVLIAGEYYVADSLTQKALLIKMHIDGTILWQKTYGNLGKTVFNDVNIFDGQIRAVGYNQFDLTNFENIHQYMMRSDLEGVENVNYAEVHDGIHAFQHITKYGSNSDDFYFTSRVENSLEVDTYQGGSDIILLNFSQGMYFKGNSFFPSNTGEDLSNEVIPTSDGGLFLIGAQNLVDVEGTKILAVKIGPNHLFPYSNTIPEDAEFVSIKENKNELNVNIYPNPVENFMQIETKLTINNVSIYSITGEKVKEFETGTKKLELEFLPQGMYYLELNIEGEKIVYKFIKN